MLSWQTWSHRQPDLHYCLLPCMSPDGIERAPGDLQQALVVKCSCLLSWSDLEGGCLLSDLEGSCLLSDLEGRGQAEVGRSYLELEDSLLQAEQSCLQMVGNCYWWSLLEMDWHWLEGMVGMEGQGEGMMVLMGRLGNEMGRLRAEEDKEQLGMDMERLLEDREGPEIELVLQVDMAL